METISATEIGGASESRGAGERHGVIARAERGVAGISRVAGKLEAVGAAAEAGVFILHHNQFAGAQRKRAARAWAAFSATSTV